IVRQKRRCLPSLHTSAMRPVNISSRGCHRARLHASPARRNSSRAASQAFFSTTSQADTASGIALTKLHGPSTWNTSVHIPDQAVVKIAGTLTGKGGGANVYLNDTAYW